MRNRLLVLLALLMCPSVMAADLSTAYQDALDNDPVLAAAKEANKIQGEGVYLALSGSLPSMSVSAGKGRTEFSRSIDISDPTFLPFSEGESENESWSVSVSQSVLNIPALINLFSSLERKKAADLNYSQAEQNLIIRVAQAYLNVLRAQDLLDSTIAAEQAVQRQLIQAQQRFDVGLVAITDVLQTTAAYDGAKVNTINAQGSHGIFFETLRTITGVNYDEVARLSDDLPVAEPVPNDEEAFVQTALEYNPGILAARKTLKASRLDQRRNWSGYIPIVSVSGSKSFSRDPLSFLGEETTNQSVRLSVSLPILQGGRNFSTIRSGGYQYQQAKHLLRQEELTVVRDTRNLFRTLLTDVVRVNANRKAIESSQAALEATTTGYEVGTRNVVDVLIEQQRLYQAIYSYADSRYNYILNALSLQYTVGTLGAEDIDEINGYADSDNPVKQVMSLSGTGS